MAVSGWMLYTDDDKLFDGVVYSSKLDCQQSLYLVIAEYPLVRMVEVEIHPREEVIRFYDG